MSAKAIQQRRPDSLRQRLARGLYSTLLRLAMPLYFARLWWRGRSEPGYRAGWSERLGFANAHASANASASASAQAAEPESQDRPVLWLHAVSLGETRAAAALIEALRQRRPGMRLLLTHGTATGRDAGAALLQPGDRQVWMPYDTPGAVRRFLRQQRPAIGLVMETEIWPNILQEAQRFGVPLVLANARLSAKSQAKGQRLSILLQPALQAFDAVLAQTEADAQRLRLAGARQVQVLGNLKFDLQPSPELLEQGRRWRDTLGRAVVLAAATRETEEAALLQAWRIQTAATVNNPQNGQRPLLLLVPRHPQRFDEVASLVKRAGLQLRRRSEWVDQPPDRPPDEAAQADVWLGDSLGEMPLYFACADVALLGGSFAPLGGQNLIEAAACACPLVMGPHTFNFQQAAEQSLAAGAALRVPDVSAGVERALAICNDPAQRQQMSERARRFSALHRGAAAAMASAVLALWP